MFPHGCLQWSFSGARQRWITAKGRTLCVEQTHDGAQEYEKYRLWLLGAYGRTVASPSEAHAWVELEWRSCPFWQPSFSSFTRKTADMTLVSLGQYARDIDDSVSWKPLAICGGSVYLAAH